MRLAERPEWELAHFVERLGNEERRLAELAIGDVRVRDRLDSVLLSLAPRLRQALQALAEETAPFTITRAARRLQCQVREAGHLLESLADEQVVERPAGPGGDYFLLPLTRAHLRALRPAPAAAVDCATRPRTSRVCSAAGTGGT
jgi:hypothetical protein